MISKICAALVLLFVVAGFCLAADKPTNDNYIVDQVRIRLSGDADVKGGALEVDCKQGVVTLAGSVESDHVRSKAEKLAKKVKGVKAVTNNLEVKKRT